MTGRGLIDKIRARSSENLKRIALPESNDRRTLDAVNYILDKNIAKVILIGKDDVRKKLKAKDLKNFELIDPENYKDIENVISKYYELRRHKGITPEEAKEAVTKDYVTFGAMLTREGYADGFAAGASHTTPDVIRTALRCLAVDTSIGVISGAFLMAVPDSHYGEDGVFIFADCGVNPEPNSNQLAGIAVSSARLFKQLTARTPRVAFLSYSTKGSAKGPLVDKIAEAMKRTKEISPELLVDGELQVDSALVPEVAKIKCPTSEVAGSANVLVFPDLNSGNIGYKLVQRLAGSRA
ncbi:MAG: phosphate acyltransferase, partial [Candidatus Omnitrophota bacterium]|nr:phosphate acyltransferase [Candidatus Omnitrophota bacterium]